MATEPNELTASINHERMPVLLSEPEHFEAFAPARPYSADAMRIVQSGVDREDLLKTA